MLKDIRAKLKEILSETKWSEPIVVYTFVEIRKILEKNPTDDRFPVIRFYADWVVHSELQGQQAYQQLKIIEKIFIEKETLYIDIPVIDKVKAFISFLELKKQLKLFLGDNNLPTIVLNQPHWYCFLDSLLNILSDSPLKMRDNNTLIKEFVFKPQLTSGDVIFEINLNNGLSWNSSTNFTYLANH